ncbi:MAG: hypothetical protein LZ171_04110 [Thaumarchaeota archaeon]|jgi:hypothetical protein|nr:hypothetical protein [Candidatus Geocrenenecus arthurdayi]
MHRSSRAVSAIVGGLIVLAILFTTIIPLIILLQNSYALFLNESNSRRIFDIDRLSESLRVSISQEPDTKQLALIVSNEGPIHVNVVRIWAIDIDYQKSIPSDGPCLQSSDASYVLSLPPGMNSSIIVQQCVTGFSGIVQFLAVTERGRIFSSEKIKLESGRLIDIVYPFTLTVSIINMRKGRWYEVYVEPLDNGKVYPTKFTHKATAANENVTVAFGAIAGKYRVTLLENNKQPDDLASENPIVIEVPDTTAVIFTLGHLNYKTVNLRVEILAPKKVKDQTIFNVEVYVSLPREANETVYISSVNDPRIIPGPGLNIDYECTTLSGFRLSPGEIEEVTYCSVEVGEAGGKERSISIIVDQGAITGQGETTGSQYTNDQKIITVKVIGR